MMNDKIDALAEKDSFTQGYIMTAMNCVLPYPEVGKMFRKIALLCFRQGFHVGYIAAQEAAAAREEEAAAQEAAAQE